MEAATRSPQAVEVGVAVWTTRRSAVDRRTATMMYASRDRSLSIRRWFPQNMGARDGLVRAAGVTPARVGSAAAVLRQVAKGSVTAAPISR